MKKSQIKVLSMMLVILFVLTNTFAVSAQFNDINAHWAKNQIVKWQDKGIISGTSKSEFKPNEPLTKAQFVTILSKIFNYVNTSDKKFSDVNDSAWYSSAVSKAIAAGIVDVNESNFMPNSIMSRQEAAIILQKAFKLNAKDTSVLSEFNDAGTLNAEAKHAFGAMVEKRYIAGKPGKLLAPADNLTRGEAVTIIDKIVSELADKPGEYTGTVVGNVVVNTKDVTLRDMTIKGNLYLAQGIGGGNVTLDNVKVLGDTVVEGGGENSIILNNTSIGGSMIVIKLDGKIRILAQGATSIHSININSGVLLQEADSCIGGFSNIQIMNILPGQSVKLDGNFDTIAVKGEGAKIDILDGSVKSIDVDKKSKSTSLKVDDKAIVSQLIANSDLNVSGKGKIEKATVKANGVSFDNKPAALEIGDKINVKVEDKDIDNSKLATLYPPVNPPAVPSTPLPPSSPSIAVVVDTQPVILNIGQTATGSAISCNPADAVISYVSTNPSVVTVNPTTGEITGVANGWAYITVTAAKNGYTSASATYKVVIPSASDTGTFWVNPEQTRKNTLTQVDLTYIPPQTSTGYDGQIEIDLPAEFPIADNNFVAHSSFGEFDVETNVKVSDDGRKVKVKNYSEEYQAFFISYDAKAPNTENSYSFNATWDEDGDDIVKTPSAVASMIITLVRTVTDLYAPYDMRTKDSITLCWTPLTDATDVEVEYTTDSYGGLWNSAALETSITATDATAKIIGLEEDTNYFFRLKVTGGESEGDSNIAYGLTADETPIIFDDGYPSILSVTETNANIAVKANDSSYTCYAVTIPTSDVTERNKPKEPEDVMYWPYDEREVTGIFSKEHFGGNGEHNFTIDGLTPDTRYTTFIVATDYYNDPTAIKELQFSTGAKVTLGDAAHFLASNYDLAPVNQDAVVEDIDDYVYKDDIMELVRAGILYPDQNKNIMPNRIISKAEFAALLVYLKEQCGTDLSSFEDLPLPVTDVEGHWGERFLRIVINLGVFTLDDSGKVYPNNVLTSDYLSQETIYLLNR